MFTGYLGADRDAWKAHDASELVARADASKFAEGIRVDQGLADRFLANQLNRDVFEAARSMLTVGWGSRFFIRCADRRESIRLQ